MARELKIHPNAYFYTEDGKFKMKVAREAYFDMMRHYDYAIPDRFHTEDFWVKDFNIGDFAASGMAGIFWFTDPGFNLSGHEIFLLPNQAIPEHWHVATDTTGPKLEAWQVRHGEVFTFAEGTPTEGAEGDVPPSHRGCTHALSRAHVGQGEVAQLSAPGERHWMKAGPRGAIVTEYATHHDHEGLRFSHPNGKFFLD